MTDRRIVVVGSINHDLVARVAHLPRPGETCHGSAFAEISGGKGANQAVAAARVGGDVSMIGRVGTDSFGPGLLTNLRNENINVGRVQETVGPSGVAMIVVDEAGENSIIVVAGANGRVSQEDVDAAEETIAAADVLLLQLEVPVETVIAASRLGRRHGTRVILDPAPAPYDWPAELFDVDIVCPNETEAEALTGIPVTDDASAFAAADRLRQMGVCHVVLTRGADGVTVVSETAREVVAPTAVTAVDTTAAGDAFAGAMAVELAGGASLIDAVRFASIGGALAASVEGAQPSLPTRAQIEAFRSPS